MSQSDSGFRYSREDLEDARTSATAYVIKDLRMVVKALEARALRMSEPGQEALDFSIELVKSVISSHE